MKGRVFAVHITAVMLFFIYFAIAGYTDILSYRAVVRRISRYHLWESMINPRGLFEQLSSYVYYRFPERVNVTREVYSTMLLVQGKKEARDFSIIKDGDGYLHHGDFYQFTTFDPLYFAKRLRRLNRDVVNSNGSLLVVGGADKYLPAANSIYSGYPNNLVNNSMLDEMLLHLFEHSVDTLDLRLRFMNSILDYSDLYYKTDRGWTARASLEAALAIMEKLAGKSGEITGYDASLLDENNYYEVSYKGVQGSLGRSVGSRFGGTDDYVALLPRFETDFSVFSTTNSSTPSRTGKFEDALLNFRRLNSHEYTDNFSTVYLNKAGEERPFRRIINKTNPAGKKIFFIGGGDFTPTAAYLSLAASELVFLSSEAKNFRELLERFFQREHFDFVVFGIEIDGVKESLFPFHAGNLGN